MYKLQSVPSLFEAQAVVVLHNLPLFFSVGARWLFRDPLLEFRFSYNYSRRKPSPISSPIYQLSFSLSLPGAILLGTQATIEWMQLFSRRV